MRPLQFLSKIEEAADGYKKFFPRGGSILKRPQRGFNFKIKLILEFPGLAGTPLQAINTRLYATLHDFQDDQDM
jgi:hypothetical protein